MFLYVSYFIGSDSLSHGFGSVVAEVDSPPRNPEEVARLREFILKASLESDENFPRDAKISIITWKRLDE
jgi:hypothetical protein